MPPKTNESKTVENPDTTINSCASAPLLRLPPEIRNIIYKCALYLDDGICEVDVATGIPEPALLLTCKEIRREAIGIFYSTNDVRLVIDSYSPSIPILM
jgi:hypothetical protein